MAPLHLYSKSSVEKDWRCPRSYYWAYAYDGKGINSSNTHLELYLGASIHDALAAIAIQHLGGSIDIDTIASTAQKQVYDALAPMTEGEVDDINFACEQAALVEGLVRGFYKHVWPRLMVQYPEIVLVEKEMIYKHDGMGFMCKPDLVVRDKEGGLNYLEYKSTSNKKDGWINSWSTAIQLHSTIRAIEVTVGEPVTSVVVVGLYKGFISYNKQSSSFCYSYQRKGNPPFSQDEISYEYKAGFKRYPTWQLPGGVKEWVNAMPENILADNYPMSPPIFVRDDLINRFFQQQAIRQNDIINANFSLANLTVKQEAKEYLDETYPQRFDQCQPSYGHSCPYNRLCFGPEVDPLQAGFEYRDTEHLVPFLKLLEGDESKS